MRFCEVDILGIWLENGVPKECDEQDHLRGKTLKNHPWKKWLLRSEVKDAKHTMDCDCCYIPICMGDSYVEEIYAYRVGRKKKIEVKRYHYPECPIDPFDDEDWGWDGDFDDGPAILTFHIVTTLRRAA